MVAIRVSIRGLPLGIGALVLLGCASQPKASGTELCSALTNFIAGEVRSGGGEVSVGRQGAWLVNHTKSCRKKDGDSVAATFCDYLMEHTSTEFMEATVNQAMACLQGQRLVGYVGNTGIAQWDGRARFYAPRVDVADAEVELSWHLTSFGDWDDHVTFTVTPTK
jgi:hypothetical protein